MVASLTTSNAQEVFVKESASAAVQLRTNGLFDLALCPNIGIEIQTDIGLAWQLDYMGAWWNSDVSHHYYSNYALQTEIRYYLNRNKISFPYTGHHVGLYGEMITYDFEFGETGYMCRRLDDTFSIGASYGYSIPLSKRWTIDFTAGIGYFHTQYDVYDPNNRGTYTRRETRKKSLFIPTKLEATFVWNINTKNNK